MLSAYGQKSEQDAYDSATLLFNNEEYEIASGEYQGLLKTAKTLDVRAKSAFKVAECAFRLGKYKEALPLFREYLSGHPSHLQRPEGLIRAADCSLFVKDYQAAADGYGLFLKENPANPKLTPHAIFNSASARIELGAFSKARELYGDLLSRYPEWEKAPDARFNLAWTCLKEQDYVKAAEAFLAFCDRHPGSPKAAEALLRAADCRYRSGKHQESLTLYNRVLAEGEGAYKTDSMRGIAWNYYKLEQYEKAAGAFLNLAAQSAEDDGKAQAYFQAVQSFHSAGQPARGLAAADEMLSKCPGHALAADTLYWKGVFLRGLDRKEEAAEALSRSIGRGPSKVGAAEVRHELAGVLLAMKKYGEAVKALEEARAGASGRVLSQILYDQARALHLSGDTGGAIKVSEELLKQAPADDETATLSRFNLGEYLFSQKKYEEAAAHYRAVLKSGKDPSTALDARYRLGWCLKFLDRPKEAIEALGGMDLSDPKNKYGQESRLLIAELHEKSGDLAKAKAEYVGIIEGRGAFAGDACLALARLHFQDKQYANVIELMKRFLSLYPGHSQEAAGQFMLAEASFESGDKAASRSAYDKVIAGKDQSLRPSALYGKAWLLYDQGAMEAALESLAVLLKEYPGSSFSKSAVQLQGKIYTNLGKPDKARDAISQWISSSTGADRGSVLLTLAGVETELKNYDRALSIYDEIAANPAGQDLGRVIYEKGWVLMQMGRPEDASAMFGRYRKEFPQGALIGDVEFAVGELQYSAKKYREALDSYAAARKDPRYLDKAVYKSAWCRFNLGEFGPAADLFSELVKTCPASALARESRYNEGLCRMKGSQYDRAAGVMEEFLASGTEPKNLCRDALFNLARIYEKLDRAEPARESYGKFIKLHPDSDLAGDAHVSLGNLLLAGKNYRDAAEHYRMVAGGNHHMVMEALFGLGEARFHLEEYPEAIKAYTETLRYQGGEEWKSAGLYRIAQCHKGLKNPEKAEKYLKRLTQEFPESEHAAKAAEELKKKP